MPSSASERATLLPSPTYATRTPCSEPSASRRVTRSASAWQGWWSAVSMFTTGTLLYSASSCSIVSGPVRTPIAAT